jgi:hypothetical protein
MDFEMDDRGSGTRSHPCSMREACALAGLDRDGERCPVCPLRDLCESEQRWLIQTAPRPLYPN